MSDILDILMPGMDGPTVLKQLQAQDRTRAIPVILITTQGPNKDWIQSTQEGMRAVISMPFSITDLESQIRRALGG